MRGAAVGRGGTKCVTRRDIDTWLVAVPQIDPRSTWAKSYVENYDVRDKIFRAKQEGYWDDIVALARKRGSIRSEWLR